MTEVIIIGAGGHAAEINEYISFNNSIGKDLIKIIGFIDDDPESFSRYSYPAPFLGSIKDHKILSDIKYLIGIANLNYRKKFVDYFKNLGAEFISLCHHSAYISQSATIGNGTIIGPNVSIGPNVTIGEYNLINSRSSIGHDSSIGHHNFLSPNTCFSGFTKVGDENFFGINSATLPGIKIGHNNKISAGMIVDQEVNDNSTLFYRFKEKILAVPKYP